MKQPLRQTIDAFLKVPAKKITPALMVSVVLGGAKQIQQIDGARMARRFLHAVCESEDYDDFHKILVRKLPAFRVLVLMDYPDLVEMEECCTNCVRDHTKVTLGIYDKVHRQQLDLLDDLISAYPSDCVSKPWEQLCALRNCVRDGGSVPVSTLSEINKIMTTTTTTILQRREKNGETASHLLACTLSCLREAHKINPSAVAISFSAAVATTILLYGQQK